MFPDHDCSTCTLAQQEFRGCHAKPKQIEIYEGEELDRCIARPIKDNPHWFAEWFNAFRHYKNHMLPNEGPINAQPIAFIHGINVIESALADCREAKEQKEKRKQGKPKFASPK